MAVQKQALRRQDGALYWEGVRLSALLQATEKEAIKRNDQFIAGELFLLALTDSTLAKLRAMTDAEFDELELYPDFDE